MLDIIIPGRVLGIFWTTASWNPCRKEPTIQLTNKDKDILFEVNSFLNQYGMDYSIYSGEDEKRPEYDYKYYRMKIYNREFIKLLREKYNWRGQREGKRYYPTIENRKQEIGFLRYYIANQGSFDYMTIRGKKRKRYRIRGHYNYIDHLNSRISKLLGVNENKPQSHSQSDKTMTLYYQSQKDVDAISGFINQG